jgi:hypothetical protein
MNCYSVSGAETITEKKTSAFFQEPYSVVVWIKHIKYKWRDQDTLQPGKRALRRGA